MKLSVSWHRMSGIWNTGLLGVSFNENANICQMSDLFNEVMKGPILVWWEFVRTAQKMRILLPATHPLAWSVWLLNAFCILHCKRNASGSGFTRTPEHYNSLANMDVLIYNTYAQLEPLCPVSQGQYHDAHLKYWSRKAFFFPTACIHHITFMCKSLWYVHNRLLIKAAVCNTSIKIKRFK